jgi:hypothetical protein
MSVTAVKTYIGRVRGEDGFSPVITVVQDTPKAYKLRIETKGDRFDTPNLRGATFKSSTVEVVGHEALVIPFSDLGLDPGRDYLFYAAAGIDYPYLRCINAIRVGHTVRVSVYYDTVPYSSPRIGSPFDGGFLKIGSPGLMAGDFHVGEQLDGEGFPVNLLCFELDEETEEEPESVEV